MKFQRCPIPTTKQIPQYVKERFTTKRRYAGAKRAVKKQKEKYGLFFEELAEFKTPEERIKQNVQKYTALYTEWREQEAKAWIKARKMYFSLPKDLKYMVKMIYEITGQYKAHFLADIIHQVKVKPDKEFFFLQIMLAKGNREKIKKIGQIDLKLQDFYKKLKLFIYQKYNVSFSSVSYYKGKIILQNFPNRNEKLNEEQERELISIVNCCFKKSKEKIISVRKAKKIVYV